MMGMYEVGGYRDAYQGYIRIQQLYIIILSAGCQL